MAIRTEIKNVSMDQIVYHLRRMSDEAVNEPVVAELADIALSQSPDGDPITAVYDFIRKHVGYAEDPNREELFIHPRVLAQQFFDNGVIQPCDCDDHSMLGYSLSRSLGVPARIELVDTSLSGQVDHAVCQVFSPTFGWINIDSSAPLALGWEFKVGARIAV